MSRTTAFVVRICAVGVIAVSTLSLAAPVSAQGVPGPRVLVAESLRTSVAMRSAHAAGTVVFNLVAKNDGVALAITESAHFRGDVSDRGRPSFHLRGQLRAGNQGKYYKLVGVSGTLAGKLGKSKWQCTNVRVAQSSGSINPAELQSLLAFVRRLRKEIHFANLGASTDGGVPVWDVEARLATRLNLSSLYAISGQPEPANLPKPWVHLKVNFWIGQANQMLRRLALRLRLRVKHEVVLISLTMRLSRYGERVPISLPPACSKA